MLNNERVNSNIQPPVNNRSTSLASNAARWPKRVKVVKRRSIRVAPAGPRDEDGNRERNKREARRKQGEREREREREERERRRQGKRRGETLNSVPSSTRKARVSALQRPSLFKREVERSTRSQPATFLGYVQPSLVHARRKTRVSAVPHARVPWVRDISRPTGATVQYRVDFPFTHVVIVQRAFCVILWRRGALNGKRFFKLLKVFDRTTGVLNVRRVE